MNRLRRILVICCFWICLGVLIFWLLRRNEYLGSLVLGEDTTYSVRYNEKSFKRVKKGLSKEEVRQLLGEPLRIAEYKKNGLNYSAWIYSMQTPTSRIHNFRMRVVVFDERNSVLRTETGLYVD